MLHTLITIQWPWCRSPRRFGEPFSDTIDTRYCFITWNARAESARRGRQDRPSRNAGRAAAFYHVLAECRGAHFIPPIRQRRPAAAWGREVRHPWGWTSRPAAGLFARHVSLDFDQHLHLLTVTPVRAAGFPGLPPRDWASDS